MKIAYMNYNPINKHLYTDITSLNIVYIFITYYTYISFYLHFQIVQVAWVLSTVIMGINIYFFSTSFIRWLVHSELPRILSTIISTLIFPFMAAYIGALIYLVFKKVNVSSIAFHISFQWDWSRSTEARWQGWWYRCMLICLEDST